MQKRRLAVEATNISTRFYEAKQFYTRDQARLSFSFYGCGVVLQAKPIKCDAGLSWLAFSCPGPLANGCLGTAIKITPWRSDHDIWQQALPFSSQV